MIYINTTYPKTRFFYRLFWFAPLFAVLCSCNNKIRTPGPDEFALSNNKIIIKSAKPIPHLSTMKAELATKYKQKPKRATGLRVFLRSITYPLGFRPVIWNEALTDSTVNDMKRLLQNDGYQYASVYYDKFFTKKLAKITYYVSPNTQFVLDTVSFYSPDPVIQALLDSLAPGSFFKKGDPLDGENYDKERVRIRNFMTGYGYARFTPNYFYFEVDTGRVDLNDKGNRKINATLSILNPGKNKNHVRYKVGSISVYPNFNPVKDTTPLMDSVVKDVHFFIPSTYTDVRLRLLRDAIRLVPGGAYNKALDDLSYAQLNRLGVYKFISYNPVIDPKDSSVFNYQYRLTPQKKMNFEVGPEINYSNISGGLSDQTSNINLLGISIDATFTHRNLFRGAERFIYNISVGTDFDFYLDARTGVALNLPKYLRFPGLLKLYNQLGFVNKKFYREFKEYGTTDLVANFNYNKRQDSVQFNADAAKYSDNGFDVYSSFDLTYRYKLSPNANDHYTISPIGVFSFFSTVPEASKFSVKLDQNPFLKKSLSNQLSTGFLFRSLTFEHNLPPTVSGGPVRYWSMKIEQSGTEILAANALYNQLSNKSDTFRFSKDFSFSKYIRFELEGRYTKPLAPKTEVAFRGQFGVAPSLTAYDVTPFLRQLYVGGPYSLRGWGPRSLGPGGFQDTTAQQLISNIHYQTGTIKLEMNAEVRFPIYWIFRGAVFADYGNVWTFNNDEQRPYSRFDFNNLQFLKQMALDTGFGLRIDPGFFTFRLDAGLKLYTPLRDAGYWLSSTDVSLRNLNYNFALGLPF